MARSWYVGFHDYNPIAKCTQSMLSLEIFQPLFVKTLQWMPPL